jgi:hypothetical protein
MNKSSNILIENEKEKEQLYEEMIEGVPVCGANFSSLVIDAGYYIDEIHYKIGNRLYIENAD